MVEYFNMMSKYNMELMEEYARYDFQIENSKSVAAIYADLLDIFINNDYV